MLSPSASAALPMPIVLPTLPYEAQKRIIHFSLALPRSLPVRHQEEDEPTQAWDNLAGAGGRYALTRRVVERGQVWKVARVLMAVCKAWKHLPRLEGHQQEVSSVEKLKARNAQKEAEVYLYLEPQISTSSLFPFAQALIRGQKRWSDLNLHPYSTPGRYVQTLDLSQLNDSYFSPHITSIGRAISDILPLVPNLTHLKLPSGPTPFNLDELRDSDCARCLKGLEGLEVDYWSGVDEQGRDRLVRLLRSLPELEVLGLEGPGDTTTTTRWEDCPQPVLDLPRLHTLVLHGVKTGVLLKTLVDSELPSLKTLVMTSYVGMESDLTHAFQQAHGAKVLSLVYLSPREYPFVRSVPAEETLILHSRLRHLGVLIPGSFELVNTILESGWKSREAAEEEDRQTQGVRFRLGHPLKSLTIPKWSRSNVTVEVSPNPSQVLAGRARPSDLLLETLVRRKLEHLTVISVDGYRWVRREMGQVAMMTGDSGEMCRWSAVLERAGVEMRDMEGAKAPKAIGEPEWTGLGGTGTSGGVQRGRRRSSEVRGISVFLALGGFGAGKRAWGVEMGSGGVGMRRSGSEDSGSDSLEEDGG